VEVGAVLGLRRWPGLFFLKLDKKPPLLGRLYKDAGYSGGFTTRALSGRRIRIGNAASVPPLNGLLALLHGAVLADL
jgi:hypothetical protein